MSKNHVNQDQGRDRRHANPKQDNPRVHDIRAARHRQTVRVYRVWCSVVELVVGSMFDRYDPARFMVDVTHAHESAARAELELDEVVSVILAEDIRVRRDSGYARRCDDRIDKLGIMTDSDTSRPAIISTLDNDQNLIITIQPSHRRNETIIGQVKVKAETIPYAQGII